MVEEMKEKVESLKIMLRKLNDHIQNQEEYQKTSGASTRMGAKLTSGNELQDWMDRQEYLR